MTLSDRLRRVQRSNSDSIEEFARAINVSESSVHKWLAGQVTPRKDKLKTIAEEYNISIEWLEYGIDIVAEEEKEYKDCEECINKAKRIDDLEKRIKDKDELIEALRDQVKMYKERLGDCEELSKQA